MHFASFAQLRRVSRTASALLLAEEFLVQNVTCAQCSADKNRLIFQRIPRKCKVPIRLLLLTVLHKLS